MRKGEPTGRCRVCAHPDRYRIELALVSGVSTRVVAKRFKVGRDSACRHLNNHVDGERRASLIAGSGPLKAAQLAEKAADEGLALLDYINILRTSLLTRYLAATEAGDAQGGAMLAGRLTDVLRLQAQCTGELSKAGASVTNNIAILQSPLMADLQAMLLRTLQPHPEARSAVLAGLEELSARTLAPSTSAAPLLIEAGHG